MPPKKTDSGASKKTQEKVKAKIVEDKTFGLKNKKGGKVQKYIDQVQKQVTTKPPARRDPLAPETAKDKKEREKEKADELKALFKPVIEQQKVAKDVDPKSVLCAFFKAGQCTKGAKCKFSHELDIERKTEKRNLYADGRDDEEDTMENWDDAKLQDVVNKKLEQEDKSKPTTDIVCRHFLQAIEDNKYGWFWECPNGGDKCMYRHALPPGFVLKKDKRTMAEQEESKITIEDLIEKERAALGGNLTKVTLESFKAWKLKKRKERFEKLERDKARKENEFQAGRLNGLSGRDMFTFRPELAGEDDDEADDTVYRAEDDEEEGGEDYTSKDIDESLFVEEEADGTGTLADGLARTGLPNSLPVEPAKSAGPSGSSGDAVVYVGDVPVEAGLFDEDDEEEDDESSGSSDGKGDERSQ